MFQYIMNVITEKFFLYYLFLSLWLYAWKPGRVLTKLNAQQSEFFLILFEIPFSNRLKVFYLHLQSPSEEQHVAHGHVFAQAKYPAVREATGKLESLCFIQ